MKPGFAVPLLLAATAAGAAVLPECAEHRNHGRKDDARTCYQAALRHRDPRVVAEAHWRLGQKQEANGAFRRAVAQRPRDADTRVAWGRLFLESHNAAEAAKLFGEAIDIEARNAGAYLGLALVAADSFDEKASEHARRALELDPKLAEARVLLARLALEEEDAAGAAAHLDTAEDMPGSPLPVLAMRTALELLAGQRPPTASTQKAFELHPGYGEICSVPAHFFVLRRRYAEAAQLYACAVALDDELWSAHAGLGVNLWRLGDEAGARRHLEIAYRGDAFDATTVNSLRLLDSLARFETVRTPRGVLRLHEKESSLLGPYVGELLAKAVETFEAKYRVKMARPLQVEVYPDHEDFAVRTLGLPGLGALGVAFGNVVAMDSPSGRPPGSFHWGSTLWHELNHAIVLELTRHRAPRWIVEGLAVYEESIAGPGWGDHLTPDVIAAIREKKLLPIVELDRGFVRPDYPGQVAVSYYQAGLVCELIAKDWGFPTLLAMLRAYREGMRTPEVIETALQISPAAFDARFEKLVAERTGRIVTAFETEWRPLMKTIHAHASAKDLAAAVEPARRARDLYPEYVAEGHVYEVLADALVAQGDRDGAAEELERYRLVGGRSPELLKRLARLHLEAGRKEKAREVLDQLVWIRPGDVELHDRLGDLWLEASQPARALREFQALLASAPPDIVSAHYKVASAYHRLQDREHTREHLLMALEQAPGYRPAQKLLLEIHRR